MIKNSDLKQYLNMFPDDAPVSIILANPGKRKLYDMDEIICLTDAEFPTFGISVGEEKEMDEECVKACEECESDDLDGQMQIEDFPEVMP